MELDSFLDDSASKTPAIPALRGTGDLLALQVLAYYGWNKTAMKRVTGRKLSGEIQRASRNPMAKKLATAIRAKLHSIWRAPPELPAENPRKWRTFIATERLASKAPEACWNKLLAELNDMLICAPGNPNQAEAHHLHVITGDPETIPLRGRLWRAWKSSEMEVAFMERLGPSAFANAELGASQLAAAAMRWVSCFGSTHPH